MIFIEVEESFCDDSVTTSFRFDDRDQFTDAVDRLVKGKSPLVVDVGYADMIIKVEGRHDMSIFNHLPTPLSHPMTTYRDTEAYRFLTRAEKDEKKIAKFWRGLTLNKRASFALRSVDAAFFTENRELSMVDIADTMTAIAEENPE